MSLKNCPETLNSNLYKFAKNIVNSCYKKKNISSSLNYTKLNIQARIIQITLFNLFDIKFKNNLQNNKYIRNLILEDKKKIDKNLSISNFVIDFGKKNIRVNRLSLVYSLLSYLIFSSFFIIGYFFYKIQNKKIKQISNIHIINNDFDFHEKKNSLKPFFSFNKNDFFIFKSDNLITKKKNYSFFHRDTFILSSWLLTNSFIVFIKVCFKILLNFLYLITDTIKSDVNSLLWKDYFYDAICSDIVYQKVNNIFITNSNWLMQPLIYFNFYKLKKISLLLYSYNFFPIQYKKYQNNIPHPGLDYLISNNILCWHKKYNLLFKSLNFFNEIRLLNFNPMYLNNIDYENNKRKYEKFILVTDVTPYRRDNNNLGFFGSYYSLSNIKKFHNDIISTINSVNKTIKVIIKVKRIRKNWSDPEYLNFINELSNIHNNVEIIFDNTGMINYIKSCLMVISIPFTSTFHIAEHYKVRSIIYDPSDSISSPFKNYDTVKFCSDNLTLKKFIRNNLNYIKSENDKKNENSKKLSRL